MKKLLGVVVLSLLFYNQNFIGNTVFADDNFDCDSEPKFSQHWYNNKCDAASKTENDLKILYSELADPMQGPQLMRITIACSKSPKGRAFAAAFFAVVTENTFQGSRNWEEKVNGNADKGYEIFTGWKSKNNLIISVKGRFVKNSSDRWSYKLKSDGKLPMLEHLKKGLTGIRGKKDWRRTCDLKYVYSAKAVDAAAVKNIKKDFSRVVKQRNSLEKEANKLRRKISNFNIQIVSLNSEVKKEQDKYLKLEKSIKEIDKEKKLIKQKIKDLDKEKKLIEKKLSLSEEKRKSGEAKLIMIQKKLKKYEENQSKLEEQSENQKKSKKIVEENLKDQEMKLEEQTEKKKIIEEKIKLQKKQQKEADEKIKKKEKELKLSEEQRKLEELRKKIEEEKKKINELNKQLNN